MHNLYATNSSLEKKFSIYYTNNELFINFSYIYNKEVFYGNDSRCRARYRAKRTGSPPTLDQLQL